MIRDDTLYLTIKNVEKIEQKNFTDVNCITFVTPDFYVFGFRDKISNEVITTYKLERYPDHFDNERNVYMYKYADSCYVSAGWFTLKNAYELFNFKK